MIRANALLFVAASLVDAQIAKRTTPEGVADEYIRDIWDARRGFPGGAAHSINATPDGYLWIGAERGLVRFDGVSFRLFDHSNTPILPTGPVLQLSVSTEGDLWLRTQEFSPIKVRDGLFSAHPLLRDGGSRPGTANVRLSNGDLFFPSLSNDAFVYHRGKLEVLQLKIPQPNIMVVDAADDPKGNLLLATRDSGLYSRTKGGSVSTELGLRERKINCVLRASNGDLWIGTETGLVRRGHNNEPLPVPVRLGSVPVQRLLQDRGGKIWAGTQAGLEQADEHGNSFKHVVDTPVNSLYQDREGGIWIGTAKGLERLRESLFITHEIPGGFSAAIFADSSNSLWAAAEGGGLLRVGAGGPLKVSAVGLDNEIIYSIHGGPDLWLGTRDGALLRVNISGDHPQVTYRRKFRRGSVFSVLKSRDGSVWVGFVSGGVARLNQDGFQFYTASDGLPSNSVSSIFEAGSGEIWVSTSNGLARFSKGSWRAFRGLEGLPSARFNCLFEDSQHLLWVGSSQGPLFFRDGRFESPAQGSPLLNEDVVGIADDKAQWIWIATTEHIFRVRRDALVNGVTTANDIFDYGPQDGLASTKGVRRDRSIVSNGHGRIWFSTETGVSVVDPGRLSPETAPAIVHLHAVMVDGKPFDPNGSLRLPSSAQRITFGFAGLSLSAPERVRYRYRLNNFDREWNIPTAVTEAAYTNLPPGKYEFHVVACNSAGLWNSAEAIAKLEILPMFWQTAWFYAAVTVLAGLAVSGVYRYRLGHLTRQLNMRFEERLSERTRIAQELHDTLLQGVISASMQLHVAVDRLENNSPLYSPLNGILGLMRGLIDEGRNTLRGLRSSGPANDLAQAFSTIHREAPFANEIEIRVVVEGSPRQLHPMLRDDIYRIGREALINALRHSKAKAVEVTLNYTRKSLGLRVRDDGRGIDPEVLRNGLDGHWGLAGMRERAERIGARFHLWSNPALGTEVEVTVPGHLAYQANPRDPQRSKAQSKKERSSYDPD